MAKLDLPELDFGEPVELPDLKFEEKKEENGFLSRMKEFITQPRDLSDTDKELLGAGVEADPTIPQEVAGPTLFPIPEKQEEAILPEEPTLIQGEISEIERFKSNIVKGTEQLIDTSLNSIRAFADYFRLKDQEALEAMPEETKKKELKRRKEVSPAGKAIVISPEELQTISKDVESFTEETGKDFPDLPEREGLKGYFDDVVKLAPQITSMVGTGIVGGAGATMLTIGSQILGGKYDKLVGEGVEPVRAFQASLADATAQAALETIGITKALSVWKPGKTVKKLIKEMAEVGGVEFVTEWFQAYPDAATELWAKAKKEGKTTDEQVDKFFEDFWKTTKQGMYEGLITLPYAALPVAGKAAHDKIVSDKTKKQFDKDVKDLKFTAAEPSGLADLDFGEKEVEVKEKVEKPKVETNKLKRQKAAVDEKIKELGSLEKVKREYINDDVISKYARTKAAEIYGGDANIEALTPEIKRTSINKGFEVQGKGINKKGELVGWDKKWIATKQAKIAGQKAGANITEYDVTEGDNGWVFQRRKVKAPKVEERRNGERKTPDRVKDKVIKLAQEKAVRQAKFQKSLKEKEEKAKTKNPEDVIKEFNKKYPGHAIKFDGIQEMPEVLKDKPNLVNFTPHAGGAKKATMALDVNEFTVEELKKKVDAKVKEFEKGKVDPLSKDILFSGTDPVFLAKQVGNLIKDTKTMLPKLQELGDSFYTGGKQKYFDWQKKMKDSLGETWEKVKRYIAGVWKKVKESKTVQILKSEKGAITISKKKVKRSPSKTIKLVDEYLGAISTRLANIDPSIKNKLMEFELDSNTKIENAIKEVLPFIKKTTKMSKEDFIAFDFARKSSNTVEINRLVEKYNIQKEYTVVRGLLDTIRSEAISVGYKSRYVKDYHPREVVDFEGLANYLHQQDDWSTVDLFIKAKEKKLGRFLTHEEKVKIVNSLFRGYADERITLSKPGQLKMRKIKVITPEMNEFFGDSNSALLRYLTDVITMVEAKKLFGGSKDKDTSIDLDETIGSYILNLVEQKKINPSQERELRSILKARFSPVGTSGIVTTFKNLTLIDVMGSPVSAVTQLGDIAWSLYKNGIVETAKVLPRAIVGKSKFTKEDLGISKIGAEFSDKTKSAKAVDTVFKATGLTKVDAYGKETLINGMYNKIVKQAQTEKGRMKLRKTMEPIFRENTDQAINDFKNKKDTRNVKLYLLRTLADFQPVTLSEMSEVYLKGGNWRILYMLKSFDLKKFDVYRREVFQKIAAPGTRLEGIRNLIRLAMFLAAMEASADVIKDLILGREVNISDTVMQNIGDLVLSRYRKREIQKEGIGTGLVKQIVPPFQFVNALWKDITTAGDKKGLEITKSIPLVGKVFHSRFGKGKKKEKSKNVIRKVRKVRKRKTRNAIRKIRKRRN